MQESSRGADHGSDLCLHVSLYAGNCLKHVCTLLIGYRSSGTPGFPHILRARDGIAGHRRGSSACQRPGDLPALHVACRCSPVGFDRQQPVYGDSLLVVQQVNKEWDVNKDIMDAYVVEIKKLENKFSGLEIHHVIRDNYVAPDVLSNLGFDQTEVPPGIFVHERHHPSIVISTQMNIDPVASETSREVMMMEVDWRVSFIDYIREQVVPPSIRKEDAEATRIM